MHLSEKLCIHKNIQITKMQNKPLVSFFLNLFIVSFLITFLSSFLVLAQLCYRFS